MYGLLPEAQLPRADSLRWLQMNSTGADAMMYPAFKESGIQLTTIGAAITVTVAEHALALLFALARNLHLQRDHQHRKEWTIETGEDIAGMTLGILGLGRIGRAVATRAHAFGMDILAIDPIARDKPHCVRALWGIDRLPDLLRQSKAIVCTVPKTPATTGMIGAQQLAMLPHGSFVVNDVKNRTGRIIDDELTVGGWTELTSAPAPPDTDKDGMPDAWETTHGLNPNDPSDASGDTERDGYTHIEEWLNRTDPRRKDG